MKNAAARVQEKLVQTFGERADVAALRKVLGKYGAKRWHPEVHRVRLAIIKLSKGNKARLAHFVGVACTDYRDVLAWAEYPAQMDAGVGVKGKKLKKLLKKDRKQYEKWLRGTPKADESQT